METKEFIFTTDDGVKIFKSDKYFYINKSASGYYECNYAMEKHLNDGMIATFSTRELAKEYWIEYKKRF